MPDESGPAELVELRREAEACTACRLCEQRTTVVFGMGDPTADLMFVGEGPGEEEDRQGLPFVGRSGKLLDRLMREELGMDRDRCYIANVVKCRPPGNRDPRPDEIAACRRFLERQVELVSPRVIVTLGSFAARTLLGRREGVLSLRGRDHHLPSDPRVVVVPTLHPAAALRGGPEALARMRSDLVRAKLRLSGR
ncbi:MAG: hypothetical protein KatS3mg008_1080 [Acidimicrobiales bacterium]|nr:MAG: hypothetical protein KatS3mg008_1080 [Acidimicrobiales bacterium]